MNYKDKIESNLHKEALMAFSKKLKRTSQLSNVIINRKPVDARTITVDGVDTSDYPDFSDAYAASASFEDGTALSEEELVMLQDTYPDVVYQAVTDSLF